MKKIVLIFFIFIIIFFVFPARPVFSDSAKITELQNAISEKNQALEEIEAEIKKYENEISKTLTEKKTLENEITRLKATASKLQSEIRLTENQIATTGFTIEKITSEIAEKNIKIGDSKESLGEIMRRMDEEEKQTLLEILLSYGNFSDFFNNLERMEYLQKDINFNLEELRVLKNDLSTQQKQKEQEKNALENLRTKLSDQKNVADINKKQKNSLLTTTKSKEANYQSMLADVKAKKEAFEKEMAQLEAQLRIEIDPKSLPPVGSGVLAWPLDQIFITQYFGNTPFATQNPQVYNGKGHGGVDFRASVGTLIKSAGNGVVTGTGNTDIVKGCYSYGQWVLIKHPTGLSTLYAHLSLTKVSAGQTVTTGQTIGYSGQTGYATGPHLHFGVYATQGVQITQFTNSINCKNAHVPIAPIEAYLNPLSYL